MLKEVKYEKSNYAAHKEMNQIITGHRKRNDANAKEPQIIHWNLLVKMLSKTGCECSNSLTPDSPLLQPSFRKSIATHFRERERSTLQRPTIGLGYCTIKDLVVLLWSFIYKLELVYV